MKKEFKNMTLAEALAKGVNLEEVYGLKKGTRTMASLEERKEMLSEIYSIDVKDTPAIAEEVEVYSTKKVNNFDIGDFVRFTKWCVEEFGRVPSVNDYHKAKEYYSEYSEVC